MGELLTAVIIRDGDRCTGSAPRSKRVAWKRCCICEHLQMLNKFFFSLRSRFHLLKHVSHTHQVVVKDVFGHVKKTEQCCVGDGVIHIASSFTADHDVAHSQNGKLLRDVCWFNLQNFAEFV